MSQRPPLWSVTPLTRETASSASLIPWRTLPWPGVYCSTPAMWKTCHTWDSSGRGGYPPTGPILCHACGGAGSVPGVHSGPRPSPDIPPLGKECCVMSTGRIPNMSWDHPGCGGGVPQVAPGHPILGIPMWVQGPRHQFHVALGA